MTPPPVALAGSTRTRAELRRTPLSRALTAATFVTVPFAVLAIRTVMKPWRWPLSSGRRTHGRPVRRFGAVVGARGTPTPTGRFAIYEIDRQPDPFGFLGPVALHLTAHSNVLDDYGGGPGRVALHGRGGASLLDPLGSAASHGCIRVDSRQAAWLARVLRPGVPVTVLR